MAQAPQKKPRHIPRPPLSNKPFWEAAKHGKLVLQYDPEAKRYQFWPRAISVASGKQNLEWREASGKGKLYSYTVTHVPVAGFEDKVPYVIGLIELDEGVRIMGNMPNVKPDQVKIGMPVKVGFEKLSDDISYFYFDPA